MKFTGMKQLALGLFISTAAAIPAAVYGIGQFSLAASNEPIIVLDNGISVYFQESDSNLVVYSGGTPVWYDGVSADHITCNSPNSCLLSFQPDGNLVTYYNNEPTWYTSTGGNQGRWLAFFDIEPYIVIYNDANQAIWHTPITPPAAPPPAQNVQESNPCAAGGAYGCSADTDGVTLVEFDFD